MQQETKSKIENFLSGLSIDIDIKNIVDIEDIDWDNAYENITDMLNDNGGFDTEVIHYSVAMEYLSENDSSLRRSLELAEDAGYSPKNLSSEILASLLKSKNLREEWSELSNDIETFFEELKEEEDNN